MRARTVLTIACAITASATCVPTGASAQQPAPPAETAPSPAPDPAGSDAPGAPPSSGGSSGGAVYAPDDPSLTAVAEGSKAVLLPNGMAAAPSLAPEPVKQAIWAANRLIGKPYKYGGGHARVEDSGYDCSGTVSYALRGAGLVTTTLDSSAFMRWGAKGRGRWITVFTNPGHAFVVIAGLRLDTSAAGDRAGGKGPRWRPALRKTRGFKARRVAGL